MTNKEIIITRWIKYQDVFLVKCSKIQIGRNQPVWDQSLVLQVKKFASCIKKERNNGTISKQSAICGDLNVDDMICSYFHTQRYIPPDLLYSYSIGFNN